jgi:phospholipase C
VTDDERARSISRRTILAGLPFPDDRRIALRGGRMGRLGAVRSHHGAALPRDPFSVQAPNLTEWRPSVVGDLTSTLGFSSSNKARFGLPATPLDLPAACPTPSSLLPFLALPEPMAIPQHQQMPRQERGIPKRRH